VTREVVERVGNRLGWSEVGRIDGWNATVTHRQAAIAERCAALDLKIGPACWIMGIGVEGHHPRLLVAESGAGLEHQLEAGPGVAEVDGCLVDRSQRSRRFAIGPCEAEKGDGGPRWWIEGLLQGGEIRSINFAIGVHVIGATVGGGIAKEHRDQRAQVTGVEPAVTVHVTPNLRPGGGERRDHEERHEKDVPPRLRLGKSCLHASPWSR
jgi:hypothetical protein